MVSTDGQKRMSMSRRVLRGFDPGKLKEVREARGITRADLARRAQTGVATIQHWESGVRSPQVDTLAQVADALGVAIADLVVVPSEERFPGDWRVLRGLTQPQLGARAGLSTSAVARIERGEIPLPDSVALNLSKALEISVDELRAAYRRTRERPAGTPA